MRNNLSSDFTAQKLPQRETLSMEESEAHAWRILDMGCKMEKRRDYEGAVNAYRQAFLMKPGRTDTWYFLNNNIGFSLNQIGKFQEAEPYLKAAIEINPGKSNAHKNLGLCHAGLGNFGLAAECFVTATKVNAADGRSLTHLEELVQTHPELLADTTNLTAKLEACRKAVETARASRPVKQPAPSIPVPVPLAQSPSTDKAWLDFGKRLALALADMDDGEHLIVEEKKRTVYVQFAALGLSGMRAEAVSTAFYHPSVELSQADLDALRALGWNPPTYIQSASLPAPKDGSCNYYRALDYPDSYSAVAELAVRTLRMVYHTPHPRFLQYKAFASAGYQIRFSTLDLERVNV